jgi:hypothetical protein
MARPDTLTKPVVASTLALATVIAIPVGVRTVGLMENVRFPARSPRHAPTPIKYIWPAFALKVTLDCKLPGTSSLHASTCGVVPIGIATASVVS